MYKVIKVNSVERPANQKFNNQKVKRSLNLKRIDEYGNITFEEKEWEFDSKREYEHFLCFTQDEKDGKIKHYIFKPPRLELVPSYKEVKLRPAYYHPDHLIINHDGSKRYIDSKGFSTAVFQLKQKLIYDKHKIYIEVKR
jgi:hypothetical protein